MDPKILKKTQDTLGKLIKKPPLTEKLLGKPPFRFLHDVMTSVIKTTGFMQGLYTDAEMNSENVKDKDAKIAFLQKAIDMVSAVSGKSLSVKPVKIVAGHEPEKTNEFLQQLADAINKAVDNDAYVKQVLKGGGGGGNSAKEEKHESHKEKEKEKDRDRTKSADRRKQRESEKEKHEKEKDGERSRDKGDRERSRDKGDRDKDREKDKERRHEKDRDRHKDRDSKTRERSRDDRHKEKSKKHHVSHDVQRTLPTKSSEGEKREGPGSKIFSTSGAETSSCLGVEESLRPPAILTMGGEGGTGQRVTSPHRHRNTPPSLLIGSCRRPGAKLPLPLASHAESLATGDHSFIGLSDHREKENESPDREKINGEKVEKQEAPSRLQRPSSAKGSRRRREAQNHTAPEDEEFQKPMAPSTDAVLGEGDLPPQVAAARQLARPSSARPAPPRPKQDVLESEPAMRLGGGQPANLIVDNDNDEDEDENFLVEETAPPPPETDLTPSKPTDEDDAEHGALVKKMLESKKELEGGSQNQTKKTEIERPVMSDAQRRKQREQVQKEVDKLRGSIQSLTRSANPLGKVMDYVQEDLDAMQQELDKWRSENAQHALDLKREMNVTDRAIEPLRQQLVELERAIGDQLGQIAATKSNIIKNDQKIQKMLKGISGS